LHSDDPHTTATLTQARPTMSWIRLAKYSNVSGVAKI